MSLSVTFRDRNAFMWFIHIHKQHSDMNSIFIVAPSCFIMNKNVIVCWNSTHYVSWSCQDNNVLNIRSSLPLNVCISVVSYRFYRTERKKIVFILFFFYLFLLFCFWLFSLHRQIKLICIVLVNQLYRKKKNANKSAVNKVITIIGIFWI